MFAELQKTEDAKNEFDTYQTKAKETAVFPGEHAATYLALGLFGEAGEVANKVKKLLRGDYDNKGTEVYNNVVDGIIDECGDVVWYASQMLLVYNLSYSEVVKEATFETFQEYHSPKISDVNDLVLQLGAASGILCTFSRPSYQSPAEAAIIKRMIAEIILKITKCICHISTSLDRGLWEVYEGNLNKLRARAANKTIQGDNRA